MSADKLVKLQEVVIDTACGLVCELEIEIYQLASEYKFQDAQCTRNTKASEFTQKLRKLSDLLKALK